jgi:Mrp family chromosome partitioning ATPase
LQLATGGGLVVIASPRTTLTDLDVIRNRADVADVPILGIILNRSSAGGRRGRRGRGAGGARVPNFVIEPADDRQTTI